MSFSILEVSRTEEAVRYGLFLDPSVDPGSDGIASFEVQVLFDPAQAVYIGDSLAYPDAFIGLTNEAEAAQGKLRTGGISLTPFENFEEPLIVFDLDVSALVGVGPGGLLLDDIFIDGIGQEAVNLIYTPFPNTAPAGVVSIEGSAEVGSQLLATNTLSDPDGMGPVSYQWYADGVAIDGADSDSIQLTLAERGKVITVVASFTDEQFFPEAVSSDPTPAVTNEGDLIEGTAGPDLLTGAIGDDTLAGFDGQDTLRGNGGDDLLQGGEGIDTAVYGGALVDYTLVRDNNEIYVSGPLDDGNDLLTNVERVQFSDLSLAFDLDGNAGLTVKLLATVLGSEFAADKALRGIGIDIFDNAGLSYQQVMDVALDVVLQSGRSNEAVVNLIWDNLVGGPIPQDLLDQLTGDLAAGAFSQVDLAVVASGLVQELGVVDLEQLTLVGVEYAPIA